MNFLISSKVSHKIMIAPQGFLRFVGLLALILSPVISLGASLAFPPSQDKDRFGGYVKVQGQKTGRWHLEQINDQWTFVNPDGNATTLIGINKVGFHNFYDEDFEEKFDGSPIVWAESAVEFLHGLQFNMIGTGSDLRALVHPKVPRMPYVLVPDLITEEPAERQPEDYKDPWSEEFQQEAHDTLSFIARKYDNDPYFVALIAGNELNEGILLWDGQPNMFAVWPKVLIDADGHTAAKDEWVALYRDELYNGDLAEFNRVHGQDLQSWDEMYTRESTVYENVSPFSPMLMNDTDGTDEGRALDEYREWSDRIHIQYQKIVYETSKQLMPYRLVGASKMRGNDRMTDRVIRGVGEYSDFMNINDYRPEPNLELYNRIVELTGKPMNISEMGFLREPCNGPYPGVATDEDRALSYLNYRDLALKDRIVLGVTLHEYSDPVYENECGYLTFGLMDKHANEYEKVTNTGRENWTNYDEVRWGADEWMSEDADRDGFSNGTEIRNGYNPYGAGRL